MKLYFSGKGINYSYDVTFCCGIISRIIVRKCDMIGAGDEKKIQRIIMCLSALVYTVEYVKLLHIDLH